MFEFEHKGKRVFVNLFRLALMTVIESGERSNNGGYQWKIELWFDSADAFIYHFEDASTANDLADRMAEAHSRIMRA